MMPLNDDEYVDYDLVMPFVACKSQGGPFDDDAFVAGHEVGVLWMRLATVKIFNALPITATIRRALLPQADLMAMHYELSMTEHELDPVVFDNAQRAEWAYVTFDYAAVDEK